MEILRLHINRHEILASAEARLTNLRISAVRFIVYSSESAHHKTASMAAIFQHILKTTDSVRTRKVQVRARTVPPAVFVLVSTVKEIYGFLLLRYGDTGKA